MFGSGYTIILLKGNTTKSLTAFDFRGISISPEVFENYILQVISDNKILLSGYLRTDISDIDQA